jgi:hypothetical protein
VDGLYWWVKHPGIPPLVTSGSPMDVTPGALGQPGTRVLLGGHIGNEPSFGARLNAGFWFSCEHVLGLEGNFLFLPRHGADFFDSSPGFPILGRPFTDAVMGTQSVSLISFPGLQTGNIKVSFSEQLVGGEVNFRFEPCKCVTCTGAYHLAFLAGYRYLELNESLSITENDTFLLQLGPLGASSSTIQDRFDTRNFFRGFNLGLDGEFTYCKCTLDILAKVAVGWNHEIVGISGFRTFTVPGSGTSAPLEGGLLALPSNIGRFTRNEFAVLPEIGVNFSYRLTPHIRARVGYTALYLSRVARPGDQIDLNVNQSQIPTPLGPSPLIGPARPAFSFKETDLWAQGFNAGLEFRF